MTSESGSKAPQVEDVKSLFTETIALTNQLRKSTDDADSVGAGSRTILAALDGDGPLTVPEIARLRATSRQNIQILVNRLQTEGSVELVANPAHRRSALVRITEDGRTLLSTVKDKEAKSLERLLSHLSSTQLTSAITSLRQVRNLLAEAPISAPVTRKPRPVQKPTTLTPKAIQPASTVSIRSAPEEDFPVNLL